MTGNIIIDFAAYWLCAGGIVTAILLGATTVFRSRREVIERNEFTANWQGRS